MRHVKLCLATLMFFAAVAHADSWSEFGTQLGGLESNGFLTTLIGGRFIHHVNENFSMGGEALTGQISNGATGSFTYGGLLGAFTPRLSDSFSLEIALLAGGAGGFTNSGVNAGGMVFEPSLSISIALGENVRLEPTGGYLWMPNNSTFSGETFGLRFDFTFGGEKREAQKN